MRRSSTRGTGARWISRIEIPRSPLEAVMAHEVWEEYYDRLAALIQAHRTTLVFVNTRRMAERLARHLSDRLGDGRGHRASRQPREGDAARRRDAAQDRRAPGDRRDRVAGAGDRHRPRRSRLPDRIAAPDRDAAAAGRAIRAHHRRPAERARLSDHARRPGRVRGAAARGRPRRARRDRAAGSRAGRAGAADRRRVRLARLWRGRALRDWCGAPGPTATSRAPISTRS